MREGGGRTDTGRGSGNHYPHAGNHYPERHRHYTHASSPQFLRASSRHRELAARGRTGWRVGPQRSGDRGFWRDGLVWSSSPQRWTLRAQLLLQGAFSCRDTAKETGTATFPCLLYRQNRGHPQLAATVTSDQFADSSSSSRHLRLSLTKLPSQGIPEGDNHTSV
ncbi:unnamed protein product [Coccothraustes coccothraustes]